MLKRIDPAGGWTMAAAYTAIAVVMTWPLSRHLTTMLASDLGDPAFNCWVLLWTAGQTLATLAGDPGALANYWNGNIFHPEPLTLAFSEHLTPQMLQMLPIYAATGNVVLGYNLLFLATFAVSGLAMYLFVRDLTARPLAAFVAGLAFAYAPYRLGQFSHLQVLSSFWMPLALLGFHRYFATGRLRALAGGALALVAQGLSCGYYLLFFPPFAAAYCLYEMTRRRLLGQARAWIALAVATVGVVALTWPFASHYIAAREQSGFGARTASENVMFGADTHAFVTLAPSSQWRLWRETFTGNPKPENEGFVGLTILALASVAILWGVARVIRRAPWSSMPAWRLVAIGMAAVVLAASLVVTMSLLLTGHFTWNLAGPSTIFRSISRPLLLTFASFAALAALMKAKGQRQKAHEDQAQGRRPKAKEQPGVGFFACALVMAALFALGPQIESRGQLLGQGPYTWLLAFVPGFDGLRVPARFLMIVALFLATLAGLGAAALLATRARRVAIPTVILACAGVLAESWFAPMSLGQPFRTSEALVPVRHLASGKRIDPLYRTLKDLPEPVVLIEFPFGDAAWDIRAMFYAGHHRRPIVNGYSGFFPGSFLHRAAALGPVPADFARATDVLRASGATHALVHEGAFQNDRGREISDWLISIGARPAAADGPDKLFLLSWR